MSIRRNSFLPDEAISNAEKFGFEDFSRLLASIISDQNLETPFTIAIHGSWGTGKTSLMKTVKTKIESPEMRESKEKCIWFSAWEFERLSIPLWAVFLNRVVMDLEDMVTEDKFKKIKAIGKGILLLSANYALKKSIDTTIKDIEEIKEELWSDVKTITCLREKLSHCIEESLKTDPKKRTRIVIFIDDLDRCLPDSCIEIFESIKLFLNCQNCVFVVGVDKVQLRKAFAKRIGETNSDSLRYVEKFIQLEFDLPRKTPEEVRVFLLEHAPEDLGKSPDTVDLISKFIEPNPRKIKRWLNAVVFLERLLKIKEIELNEIYTGASLAPIWLFLRWVFPDFADKIESDPSIMNAAIRVASGKYTEEDKRKVADCNWDKRLTSFLASLNPNYKEEQLRTVVYLSKITSTTPSQIKKCPKCSSAMHGENYDSWEGDSDGCYERYITKYVCSKCDYFCYARER